MEHLNNCVRAVPLDVDDSKGSGTAENFAFHNYKTVGKKQNCVICGGDVIYLDKSEEMVCFYCKDKFVSGIICENNHYVCDACHSLPANEIIMNYCVGCNSINPFEMAQSLMKHPSIKMHGPEHHFMIPAILLSCYFNARGGKADLPEKLQEAQKRAKNVLGGFCGYYGSCGAAVGTGIFMSIAIGATPLSKEEWKLANLMTSAALENIALNGGPRCCKRNTFIALETASSFIEKHLNVRLESDKEVKCSYSTINKECKGIECRFFKEKS